jgi:putative DNA primase/helicase
MIKAYGPEAMPVEAQDYATDLDAAARFAANYADRLRFVRGLGWHAWDGQRWSPNADGDAMEFAKSSARSWTAQAVSDYGENRDRRVKAAMALEGAVHIRAAVQLAKTDSRLVVRAGKLDSDLWKLNTLGGTLDLRTGTLHPHNPSDYISKLAPVQFREGATHPALDRLLTTMADTCGPDMPAFLARCIGCALTGDVGVESLFLLQGEGGAGKTTLIEAASAMLGDYAVKLAFESFVLSRHGRNPGGATPDLVRLRGARLAFASEGDQSARLDAGIIKTLTGGESVTARPLYQDPVTFPATWKLWLVSNYDPQCDADDTGLWRRLIKLKFEPVPPERRDPRLKEALLHEPAARSALLAWALKGCLDWQQRGGGRVGLAPPNIVDRLTDEYREAQDITGLWWGDLMAQDAELDRDGFALTGKLRQHYEEWCKENGTRPLGVKRFAEYLEKRGLYPERIKAGRGYKGLRMSGYQ